MPRVRVALLVSLAACGSEGGCGGPGSLEPGFGSSGSEEDSGAPTEFQVEGDDAVLRMQGLADGDLSGWPVGAAGDLTGDGVHELVIGSHQETDDPDETAPRRLYLVDGAQRGDMILDEALGRIDLLEGVVEAGTLGRPADHTVDLDGDGHAELVLWADMTDSTHVVVMTFWGPVEGALSMADATLSVNDDLFVDSSTAFMPGVDPADGGPAFMLLGTEFDEGERLVGYSTAEIMEADLSASGGVRFEAFTEGGGRLSAVSAGDVDGDGVPEVVVHRSSWSSSTSGYRPGAVLVLPAEARTDDVSSEDVQLFEVQGGEDGTLWSSALGPVGDQDGDGLADLGVVFVHNESGSDSQGVSHVRVFSDLGAEVASPDDAEVQIEVPGSGADIEPCHYHTGTSVLKVRDMQGADLDGDGRDDLAIGRQAASTLVYADHEAGVFQPEDATWNIAGEECRTGPAYQLAAVSSAVDGSDGLLIGNYLREVEGPGHAWLFADFR